MEDPPSSPPIDLYTINAIECTTSAGNMPPQRLPPPPIQTLDQYMDFCDQEVDDHFRAVMVFDEIPKRSSDADITGSPGSQPDEQENVEPFEPPEFLQGYQDISTSQPSSLVLDGSNNLVDETEDWISHYRSDTEVDEPLLLVPSGSSSWYMDMEKPSMVGSGLANLGNTCFLNAVLQCVTHTVLLIKGLCSYTHVTPCDCNGQSFCLLCALWEHIDLSLSATRKIVIPLKFIDNLSYFSSTFRRFQQEDAHEFLQCFLDRLENSCFSLKAKDGLFTSQNINLVKQVFGGRVVSKLRCCNCNHCSDTYEPSVDLSLEIEDANNLSTALNSFTKVERLEDEDMTFTCEKCNQKVSIEKQLMLDQIPLVCALHLKRFKNDGCYLEKIDKHVDFPLELDLQPYTSSSQASDQVDLNYDLYAVVVHETITSTCGHYYCYIRSAPGLWYKFDDSEVIKVSEGDVLSDEAYILFYTKHGTPSFSNFIETYKLSMDQKISNNSPKSVLDNVDYHCTSSSTSYNPFHNVSDESKSNASQCDHRLEVQNYAGVASVRHDMHVVPALKDCQNGVSAALLRTSYDSGGKTVIDIDNVFSLSVAARPLKFDVPEGINPEMVFKPNPEQSKMVKKTVCKRQQSPDVDESATREALKLCRKLPGARGNLLMAALGASSKSKGSIHKRGKKMTSFFRKKGSHFKHNKRKLMSRKSATFTLG